jgi:hypothetical protein
MSRHMRFAVGIKPSINTCDDESNLDDLLQISRRRCAKAIAGVRPPRQKFDRPIRACHRILACTANLRAAKALERVALAQ